MIVEYNLNKSSTSQPGSSFYSKTNKKELIDLQIDQIGRPKMDRTEIKRAIDSFDYDKLKKYSAKLYSSNLIYSRIIDYFSNLLCYYWMVTPKIRTLNNIKKEELINKWWDSLNYIETINPEYLCPSIVREVLIKGDYYIAVKEKESLTSSFGIQTLPRDYCRVTKQYLGRDVVDFNLGYFSDAYKKEDIKEALNFFPRCISEAYKEYKRKSSKKSSNQREAWVSLDPDYAFRFSLREDGLPYFIAMVLDLLDVDDMKDITMVKFEQELSKIIIQKFGYDKEGHPLAELEDMRKFHRDACSMISDVPGVDVMTTYGDISVVDLKSRQSDTSTKDGSPVEIATRNAYNAAGVSKLMFNAENSGTLKTSVISDESLLSPLLEQFKTFLQVRLDVNFSKGAAKKAPFTISIPNITINNRADMAKLYKEQVTIGFSKFLPGIALGERQSTIMAMLRFENDVLEMGDLLRPPLSSNVISKNDAEHNGPGRKPMKEEDISEKTAANKETL